MGPLFHAGYFSKWVSSKSPKLRKNEEQHLSDRFHKIHFDSRSTASTIDPEHNMQIWKFILIISNKPRKNRITELAITKQQEFRWAGKITLQLHKIRKQTINLIINGSNPKQKIKIWRLIWSYKESNVNI